MQRFLALVALVAVAASNVFGATNQPLEIRGYYVTFMRMPTFGLPEWKQMIDAMRDDGANTLILWTAGGFRSQRYPITWKYNADHRNVERDYGRDLIDYAHTQKIKVLLGFTPFAYDGANQYPLEHPELKATQKNGKPADFWGLHAWGYNLCPAQPASQKFMRDYIREMFLDFYPNADGLLIESSDYAICYCAHCRERYFDHEFEFVRGISDDVWRAKTNATIMVYPHYFSRRKVPGFDVAGTVKPFDARWTLFFTPHSAHIDPALIARAKQSVFSDSGISLGSPATLRDAARVTRKHGITGYIASCEPFSCIDGPPGSNKPRQKPFYFEWLRDGAMPLNELPIRVNRIAFRAYTENSALSDADFNTLLGRDLFGSASTPELVKDALFLQETWFREAGWFRPSPLLQPAALRERAAKEKWSAERLDAYRQRVDRLREIGRRHQASSNDTARELARISNFIVQRWDAPGAER
jgi:hypothetical protein